MENSKDHKAAAEPPLDCRVRGRGMRAWIIEGPTGVMLPSACGRTKKEAIANLIGWCNWILFPTWEALRKEGFRAVIVEITKKPSNDDDTDYVRADLVRAAMPDNWRDDPATLALGLALGMDEETA